MLLKKYMAIPAISLVTVINSRALIVSYISPDKNGAQVKKEVLVKHLQTLLQPLLTKEVWAKKQTGTIPVDRRKLVSIVLANEFDARLDWNHAKAADLKLDVGLVESQFKAEFIFGSGGSLPNSSIPSSFPTFELGVEELQVIS